MSHRLPVFKMGIIILNKGQNTVSSLGGKHFKAVQWTAATFASERGHMLSSLHCAALAMENNYKWRSFFFLILIGSGSVLVSWMASRGFPACVTLQAKDALKDWDSWSISNTTIKEKKNKWRIKCLGKFLFSSTCRGVVAATGAGEVRAEGGQHRGLVWVGWRSRSYQGWLGKGSEQTVLWGTRPARKTKLPPTKTLYICAGLTI